MSGFIHGHRSRRLFTPTYNSWRAMKARCDNPKNDRYANYGGRGITYTERWAAFEPFLMDMGERPVGKNLGRRDADGPYNEANCLWEWEGKNSGGRRSAKKK